MKHEKMKQQWRPLQTKGLLTNSSDEEEGMDQTYKRERACIVCMDIGRCQKE